MGDFAPHRVRGSGQSGASAGILILSCSFGDFRKKAAGGVCTTRISKNRAKAKTLLLQRFLQQPEYPSQAGIRTESLCLRPSESTEYNH